MTKQFLMNYFRLTENDRVKYPSLFMLIDQLDPKDQHHAGNQ